MPVGDFTVGRVATADTIDTIETASVTKQEFALAVSYEPFTQAVAAQYDVFNQTIDATELNSNMDVKHQSIPDDGEYYAGNTALLNVSFDTSLIDSQFLASEITFTLAETHGEEPIILKTDNDAGIDVVDVANQEVQVKVRGNETSGLGDKAGKYYDYEITLRDPSGDIAHVVKGPWEIQAASATL